MDADENTSPSLQICHISRFLRFNNWLTTTEGSCFALCELVSLPTGAGRGQSMEQGRPQTLKQNPIVMWHMYQVYTRWNLNLRLIGNMLSSPGPVLLVSHHNTQTKVLVGCKLCEIRVWGLHSVGFFSWLGASLDLHNNSSLTCFPPDFCLCLCVIFTMTVNNVHPIIKSIFKKPH